MNLRPYQNEALSNIATLYATGSNRQLVVWGTGAGKTVLMSHLPKMISKPGQVLILAHREELVDQTVAKMHKYNPDLLIQAEMSKRWADPWADVIVASVQTLGGFKDGEPSDRIKRFNPYSFKLICVDEVHHAAKAASYHQILKYFGVYPGERDTNWSSALALHVTATPDRTDGLSLENVATVVAHKKDLVELIQEKWLCDVVGYRVNTQIDISQVKTRTGDFAIGELEEKINTPERNKLVVSKYREHGEGRPAFAFTVDIAHSEDLAAAFRAEGYRAQAISERTKKEDRRAWIEAMRRGEMDALCSCLALTEGTDVEKASVGLMCRPTKSSTLFRQCFGRVLRPYPSPEDMAALAAAGRQPDWVKPYAIWIDFCDTAGKHSLRTIGDISGINPNFDLQGSKLLAAIDKAKQVQARNPGVNITKYLQSSMNIRDLDGISERIDVFGSTETPEEIKRVSNLAWGPDMSGGYWIDYPGPGSPSLRINQNILGKWEIRYGCAGTVAVIGEAISLAAAVAFAESKMPKDATSMLANNKKWRNDPPTPAQIERYLKLYPEFRARHNTYKEAAAALSQQATKGQISIAISARSIPSNQAKPWKA